MDCINDGNIEKVVINSLCIDARGGETREDLTAEIDKLNRTVTLHILLIVTCILYAMNYMMQSLCEKYFSSGSVSSHNCIQLLYTYYVLQNEYEPSE